MNLSTENLIYGLFPLLILMASASCLSDQNQSTEFNHHHVSKDGSDSNPGNQPSPFLTISKAAEIAMPGDTITVGAGSYREWVRPMRGGYSEDNRITYQAAPGEDVRIMGSEPTKGWTQETNGLWKVNLPDTFFGDFNPFNRSIRHPQYVEADESGDGWGWLRYGRWCHLGDVYLKGEGLSEKQTPEEVDEDSLTWHVSYANGITTILANFGRIDPNESEVEINVRPFAFYPDTAGLGYITFRGFTVMNVATHWAPPTVPQPGAIGANGGHHWIIEDNIVLYSKTVAISIGIPTGAADEDSSGHHIIRNNVLMRCGQAGTTGQWWADHSQIVGNHIEGINYREEFGGWETAGIKHHAADSLIVRDNFIRDIRTADPEIGAAHGIWNDWRNTNWRVSSNIVLEAESFPILVEANWGGPNLYENNIFVGGEIATFSSRGDAWVHNLFIDNDHRWINQDWSNRPPIGNLRWFNNIFLSGSMTPDVDADSLLFEGNAYLGGAAKHYQDESASLYPLAVEGTIIPTDHGVLLHMKLDEDLVRNYVSLITPENLDLPFSFDATVNDDFFGEERHSDKNVPGPFATLTKGESEVRIYKYLPIYDKAVDIISGR